MSIVLVLCVAVCMYVAEMQFGLNATLSSQGKQITQSTTDQVWAAVFNEPSGQYLADKIRELSAVRSVAAQRQPSVFGAWEDTVHDKPCFEYIPVQPNYFAVRGAVLASGRFFTPADSGRVAVIGSEVAARKSWSVGSIVQNFAVREQYTVIGVLAPTEGEVNLRTKQVVLGMDNSVYVPFDCLPTEVRPLSTKYYGFSYIIQAEPGRLAECVGQVENLLTEYAPGSFDVEARPMQSTVREAVDNFARSFDALTWITFGVSAVAFSSVFLARVSGQAKEIGIRRALGMSGRRVASGLILEAVVLSLIGVCVATVVFWETHNFFSITWGDAVSLSTLAPLIAVGVLVGPLGVLGPAMVAARISPLSSIRDELNWGSQRRRLDLRQAYALIALGLAVAAICFSSSLGLSTVSGVDRRLRAVGANDVEVLLDSLHLRGQAGAEEHAALEEALPAGVASVLVHRNKAGMWAPNGTDWASVSLVGFRGNLTNALGFACSSVPGSDLADDEVILGSTLALQLGDTPVGKTVLIGADAHPFRVVGVLTPRPKDIFDRGSDRNGTAVLSLGGYMRASGRYDPQPRIVLRSQSPAVADAAVSMVFEVLGSGNAIERPFGLLRQLRSMQVRFTTCIFLGSVTLTLAVSVAVGVIMVIRMWEMRRSMAIQIAVGSTSRQVASSMGRDALAVTLVAASGGITVGLLGYLLFSLARKLPLQFGLAGALVTALVGLALAGLLGTTCFLCFRGKSVAQYLHD